MNDTSASGLGNIVAVSKRVSQRRTCLYVEESQADLLLVERLIARRIDLILLTADSGPLGLKMAQDHQPDIILLDINLPDASGLEVLAILRSSPSTARIPVTALSSNAFPSQIAEGLKNGFFRYLTKPFRIAEFMTAIDDMLLHARQPVTLHEPSDVRKPHQGPAAGTIANRAQSP